MKKLLLLITFTCIAFYSCDGRDRANKTNTEVLVEHKLLDSFSEKIEYIPKNYSEVVIDSVLSNGYSVKTKFYTDMENSISNKELTNSITSKTVYREFIAEIKVKLKDKSIFNQTIDKPYLIKEGAFTKDEANLYVINDFNLQAQDYSENIIPTLSLHYAHINTHEIKIVRFYFIENKSFFEIIT